MRSEVLVKNLQDVFGSVWLGTAILTYDTWRREGSGPKLTASELAFGQKEIQDIAQRLTTKTVQNARISQWTNADHPDSSYAYLRALGPQRRLAAPAEVQPRPAIPYDLLPSVAPVLRYGGDTLRFGDLVTWVAGNYADIVATWPRATDSPRPRATPPPTTATSATRPDANVPTTTSRVALEKAASTVDQLRAFLTETPTPSPTDTNAWLAYALRIRVIQGNVSNMASLVATILAHDYIVQHANAEPYDAVAKPQGAPGLDIEARTRDGARIVGEIKTTVAYGDADLGAAQKASFLADFEKLRESNAPHRFFFLVDRRTFDIVRKKYSKHLAAVKVVLLPDGDTFGGTAEAQP